MLELLRLVAGFARRGMTTLENLGFFLEARGFWMVRYVLHALIMFEFEFPPSVLTKICKFRQ